MRFRNVFLLSLGLVDARELNLKQRQAPDAVAATSGRTRESLNDGWRFRRWEFNPDNIVYDKRTDTPPQARVLKPWILPSANEFISDPAKHYTRPSEEPPTDIPYVASTFNDKEWEDVELPHDWAIKGPFYTQEINSTVGGGHGRLPIQGVGWYRRKLSYGCKDRGKRIYLDVDGAMSYAMVWVNGQLAGGWPFGYNSFRIDLTPHLKPGRDNQLAIRLDNPLQSSRWYPGAGIYRNVWLVKVKDVHVAHWGTFVTTKAATAEKATVELALKIKNSGKESSDVQVLTDVHVFDPKTKGPGAKVAEFAQQTVAVAGGQQLTVNSSVEISNPQLWGPVPQQKPNLYVAVTKLVQGNSTVDTYTTRFGIRIFEATGEGLLVNGERIYIQGVNQHHDLGALGAAYNMRAAERQLQVLHELGSNAVRSAHNPPAPELLDLLDEMGFLVMDESFDCWQRQKNPNDFHLIFDDWAEADIRSMMRRDRNHPSIFSWSIGNEVGEQTEPIAGVIGGRLASYVHEEDPYHGATASMNVAKPNQSFPHVLDHMSLNYQGEGIRDGPAYANFTGTRTGPLYPAFHAAFPKKLLLSSETAAALSTRGTYFFPVHPEFSVPQTDLPGGGGEPFLRQVSAYELYTAPFGSSADKVFQKQDENPYVAGEFVWTGWDYLGEPTPYYTARSSYFGIVDLAGFKKDRFHLYQARWRKDLKTAHILPHWNWPERVGEVTPVHVFSAADEAELFVNGKSQGKLKKAKASEYRFRWDQVEYEAGTVDVVTYKDGREWANDTVRTTGAAVALRLTADRAEIDADGKDLSFLTLEIVDDKGVVVPRTNNTITFEVADGQGEIVATDNGNPYDFTVFASKERKAFGGLALAIVRAKRGSRGAFTVTAKAEGLEGARVTVVTV